MTMGDNRRAMAYSAVPQPEGEPYPEDAPNLFAPVSTQNRITGSSGGARRNAQPVAGSAYGYGQTGAQPSPSAGNAKPMGYQPPGSDLFAPPYVQVPVYRPAPRAVPARGYTPAGAAEPMLHPLREITPEMIPQADPWEQEGWKPPQRENAPPPGYSAPTAGYNEPPYQQPYYAPAPPAAREVAPPFTPQSYSQPYYPPQPHPVAEPPRERETPYGTHGERTQKRIEPVKAEVPPARRKPPADAEDADAGTPPAARGTTVGSLRRSWRLVLMIAVSLALVFFAIQFARMLISLVNSEQGNTAERDAYYAMAGVEPGSSSGKVELLPAGQTYAPTATPVAVQTPTPQPRIAQNDPLIGVIDGGGAAADQPTAAPETRTLLERYPDNPMLVVDGTFAEQRAANADVVGLLTIDGVLNETLVQRNNTYYLTHNANGAFATGGALFIDEGCSLTKPAENLLIRGQTTVEGKLFAPLALYGTQGKDYVSQHGIVTCNTIYEQARYVVFAVIHADSNPASPDYFNYAGNLSFQTDEQMLQYVANAKQRSMYQINVGVQATDRLLTLATLTESDGTSSWVLLCRMLRSSEQENAIQTE